MPNLTTKLSLIEDMSEKMAAIADSGHSALDSLEAIGTTADSSTRTAAAAADGVATALNSVTSGANEAASATDSWTSAVGNYDKSALEAVYSTEELVEMGLKSADALSEQNAMFALCEQSADQLTQSLEATTEIEAQLAQAQEEATQTAQALADADGVSSVAKEEYSRAVEEAVQAMEELQRAQEEANSAMENYDSVLSSGTTDLDELEAAAERAGHAAESLAEANGRASTAADELSKATGTAGEELENAGTKGMDAVNDIESALAAAGITVMLKEMAESAYELADAFSEAEKTVVLATGATDEVLSDLEGSMMSVYSTAKSADLSSTAGAVGEINTRLGLTGDKLEEVTGQFLDYANVTGQNVVPAVGNVTKLMNQWGVELDGLPDLLDKLTYAGQISGINVGNLTDQLTINKGVLDSLGFSLEDSIGLFAQLELQGVSVQTAMTGFRTALNGFADSGLDADEALKDVINDIVTAGSESEATAIAVDNFGSRAGAALASSLRSGALSIEDLTSALDGAEGALETTAEASQTMSEKWQQAGNNMKTAFTNALQPTIDKASSTLAGITNGVATFLKDHPTVVKAITAIATAVGVFTAAIVAYTVATKAATIAQAALTAVMDTNPFFLVASAIAAVTVALVGFAAAMIDTAEQEENLSYSSRAQKEELEDLQSKYDEACDKFGEASYQAQELQWQINELSSEYENNKQTLEEWATEFDEAMSEYDEFSTQRQNNIETTQLEGDKILNLATRLQTLADKTDLSAAEQQEMLAIMKELNNEVPGLALSYDNLSNGIQGSTEAIIALAEAEVARRKYDTYNDELIASIEKRTELQNTLTKAQDEYNATLEAQEAAQKKVDDLLNSDKYKQYQEALSNVSGDTSGRQLASQWQSFAQEINSANDELDTANSELEIAAGRVDEATAAINDNEEAIANISGEMADLSNSSQNAFADAQNVSEAIDAMAQSVTELAAEYQEAYNAAYESFSGQFGLFDEAKANMDSTVANAQAALDSQLAYWDNYLANVNVLKETSASDLNITQENYDALMAYVQDGSAEAAGLAQSMVDAINSGDEEAVATLANTLGEVESKKEQAASAVAEWQIDFNGKMDEIVQKAEQSVKDMNLSREAAAAASNTINAYADAILAQGGKAIANAQSIANQVKSALSSANVSIPGVSGYASGTDYATPGPHLVGENGPEIIEFRGGEKVYTNEETERIMARSAAVQYFSRPEGATAVQSNSGGGDAKGGGDTKTIRLEINGAGAIEVNSDVDEETVVAIMQQNLKPVLTSIVRQEIYEEGDNSYDY